MTRRQEVPGLLEQYIVAAGSKERRVMIRKLRFFFPRHESAGPAFSGFPRKIHHGPFFTCRYKASRMEMFRDTTPPYRMIGKYFVRARPVPGSHQVSETQ